MRHFLDTDVANRGKVDCNEFCRRLRTCVPSCAKLVRLLANEILYRCGVEDSNIYFIENGYVKIQTLCPDGNTCLVDISTQGDIVGESCLFSAKRMEMVVTMTRGEFRMISRAQFLAILLNNNLIEECLAYFSSKLSEKQQIISDFVTQDSERRLAAALLRIARKLGNRHEGRLEIDTRITQAELAEIVGATRSRVGYFLKRFRTARLIEATSQSSLIINEELLDEYIQTWA